LLYSHHFYYHDHYPKHTANTKSLFMLCLPLIRTDHYAEDKKITLVIPHNNMFGNSNTLLIVVSAIL
jgi:hypothetical protein